MTFAATATRSSQASTFLQTECPGLIMRFLRILAFVFIFFGCALLGRDGLASLSEGSVKLLPLGELWFHLSPGSLNALQAGAERYVSVGLWDSVITPILHVPAFVYPTALGLILMLVSLRRGGR